MTVLSIDGGKNVGYALFTDEGKEIDRGVIDFDEFFRQFDLDISLDGYNTIHGSEFMGWHIHQLVVEGFRHDPNIKTGLAVRVEERKIPLSSREVVVFTYPDSDLSAKLPVPELTVGTIWILQFSDRETKEHHHMMILSKKPKVEVKKYMVGTVDGLPEMAEQLKYLLEDAGVPEDAYRRNERLYGRELVRRTYIWDEVTA